MGLTAREPEASAKVLVNPAALGISIAFLSARNDLGYHNPWAESLAAHHEHCFENISKKWLDNTVAIDLI
jgi:hypothetical protein